MCYGWWMMCGVFGVGGLLFLFVLILCRLAWLFRYCSSLVSGVVGLCGLLLCMFLLMYERCSILCVVIIVFRNR